MSKKKPAKQTRPKFKCCQCGHTWDHPKPYLGACPDCDSVYYEWTNYAEWRKRHMKDSH